MKVTLKKWTDDPEIEIGYESAICYDGKTDPESCIKRAIQCKKKTHLATMRFAWATFNVSGISRVCSHQLVRIAHAGILQRSQRYCAETDVQFVDPCVPIAIWDEWTNVQARAYAVYRDAIDAGMKKEDARYILPQGCETELNICMNFQGWTDFLENRLDKSAQWEIRAVAVEINKLLHGLAPNLFLIEGKI